MTRRKGVYSTEQHIRTGRFLRILSSVIGVDWARHGYTRGDDRPSLSISVPSLSAYISAPSLLTDYSGIPLLNFTYNVESWLSDVLLSLFFFPVYFRILLLFLVSFRMYVGVLSWACILPSSVTTLHPRDPFV